MKLPGYKRFECRTSLFEAFGFVARALPKIANSARTRDNTRGSGNGTNTLSAAICCTLVSNAAQVKSLGPTIACTITAHHLLLTVDDWAGQPLNYCKPVAKAYEDRRALRQVIADGHERFFLGSDSAPHPFASKMPQLRFEDKTAEVLAEEATCACAAGVYTSPNLLPLVAHAFETSEAEPNIPLQHLEAFASSNGRRFYKVPITSSKQVTIVRTDETSPKGYSFVKDDGEIEWVIPFKAGKSIGWRIQSA